MNEELSKLIQTAEKFSEKSNNYFIDVEYSGHFGNLDISIRSKETNAYIKRITSSMKFLNIEKLIEFIENYEGGE